MTGSIVASRFTVALAAQPPQVAGRAGSLAAALSAARHYGQARAGEVAAAFTRAMDAGLWVTAAVCAAAALISLLGAGVSQND